MPIFQEQRSYRGIEFKLKHYEATDKRRDTKIDGKVAITELSLGGEEACRIAKEFLGMSKKLSEGMAQLYGTFEKANKTPAEALSDYGANDLIIEYGYSNIAGFEGAKVVEAETESGGRALELIEHCMNELKTIPGFIPLSQIPFLVEEASSNGKRCAQLFTKAGHLPAIEEICHIYVAERN